jgi:nicotinamide-nucleotide amidase
LGSIVSYSEVAKEKALGVNRGNLQKYFATSPEVTKEMAENALKIFDSDISVAITGIAGPETDSSKREVGTTFISVSSKNSGTITREFRLFGNREKIRFSAAMRAITMLIEFLSGRGTENEKG